MHNFFVRCFGHSIAGWFEFGTFHSNLSCVPSSMKLEKYSLMLVVGISLKTLVRIKHMKCQIVYSQLDIFIFMKGNIG
jgi:hypothetical protein